MHIQHASSFLLESQYIGFRSHNAEILAIFVCNRTQHTAGSFNNRQSKQKGGFRLSLLAEIFHLLLVKICLQAKKSGATQHRGDSAKTCCTSPAHCVNQHSPKTQETAPKRTCHGRCWCLQTTLRWVLFFPPNFPTFPTRHGNMPGWYSEKVEINWTTRNFRMDEAWRTPPSTRGSFRKHHTCENRERRQYRAWHGQWNVYVPRTSSNILQPLYLLPLHSRGTGSHPKKMQGNKCSPGNLTEGREEQRGPPGLNFFPLLVLIYTHHPHASKEASQLYRFALLWVFEVIKHLACLFRSN